MWSKLSVPLRQSVDKAFTSEQSISLKLLVNILLCSHWRIQDFPEEGTNPREGAPIYCLAKFRVKLYEI